MRLARLSFHEYVKLKPKLLVAQPTVSRASTTPLNHFGKVVVCACVRAGTPVLTHTWEVRGEL